MIKINVRTLFDITATGVTGHFKTGRIPFEDRVGHKITDLDSWNRARNQQRNWETLVQVISLRTQISDIVDPCNEDGIWTFEFFTEVDVFNDGTDPVGVLKLDSNGVPMLRELDNDPEVEPVLVVSGPKQNIWFTSEPINNILEN